MVVSERYDPKGLSFAAQRTVVVRRDVHEETFPEIAKQVKDLSGKKPTPRLVADYYRRFSAKAGRVRSQYHKCGRKAFKVTKEVEAYLCKRLKALRRTCVCTSQTLQLDLAKAKKVRLSLPWIRKILRKHGFRWLPKRAKKKYDAETKAQRLAFAKHVVSLTVAQLKEKLSFAMDGVILSIPPSDPVARYNFCRHGETHVWRKASEAMDPDLAGADEYGKQVPLTRAVPLWGGCSAGGFAVVLFHEAKKLNQETWGAAVAAGKLKQAIKKLGPVSGHGPWHVIADKETFLRTKLSSAAYKKEKIRLWKSPRSHLT